MASLRSISPYITRGIWGILVRADVFLLSISTYTLCARNEQRTIPSENNKLHLIYFFLLKKNASTLAEKNQLQFCKCFFHQIIKNLGLRGVSLQFLLSFRVLEWDCCLKPLEDFEISHPTTLGFLCCQHWLRAAIHHSQTGGCVGRF